MPAGPGPMGFVYFLSAKFVGYTAFCHWVVTPQLVKSGFLQEKIDARGPLQLASSLPEPAAGEVTVPSSVKAGVVRTLIGLVVGVIVGLGFWTIPFFSKHDTADGILFFSLLVPVRVGEWSLLYAWIYRMRPFSEARGWRLITFGLFVSFALDAIGIFSSIVLPGGMWVC